MPHPEDGYSLVTVGRGRKQNVYSWKLLKQPVDIMRATRIPL